MVCVRDASCVLRVPLLPCVVCCEAGLLGPTESQSRACFPHSGKGRNVTAWSRSGGGVEGRASLRRATAGGAARGKKTQHGACDGGALWISTKYTYHGHQSVRVHV